MDYVQLEKDVKIITRSVDHCNEEIDKANGKINSVGINVEHILSLLRGSPIDKTDLGLIGVVMENEKRIGKLERWRDRLLWIIIGMSLTSGYAISDLISKLIKKH